MLLVLGVAVEDALQDLGVLVVEVDLVAVIAIQSGGKQELEKAGFRVFSPHERSKSILKLVTERGYDHACNAQVGPILRQLY